MKKPYLKLRRLIEDEGLEQQELAVLAGICDRTLSKRLNAPEDSGCWLPREITAICQVLHIPQEKSGSISSRKCKRGIRMRSIWRLY
jgi:hypothetical protein